MDVNALLDELQAPLPGEGGEVDKNLLPAPPEAAPEEQAQGDPTAATENLVLAKAKLATLVPLLVKQQEVYAFEAQILKVDKVDKALAMEVFTMLPSSALNARLTSAASRSNRALILEEVQRPLVQVDDVRCVAQMLLDVFYKELGLREQTQQYANVYSDQIQQEHLRLKGKPPVIVEYGKQIKLLETRPKDLLGVIDTELNYAPYAGTLNPQCVAFAAHPQMTAWNHAFYGEESSLEKHIQLAARMGETVNSRYGDAEQRKEQLVRLAYGSMDERELMSLAEVLQHAFAEAESLKALRHFLHPQSGIVSTLVALAAFLH